MISDEKLNIIKQYDQPIIWNVSIFGNDFMISMFDTINKKINKIIDLDKPIISSVHGSYSCKYNGGREALFTKSRTDIKNTINKFNKSGIGVKLTFSNMDLHKEQFEDEELRWYLDILNETKGIGNGIICVNDDFAEIIKKNYPNLDIVASHVKMEMETKMGITDTVEYYNNKFDLYDIVVFNTYRAFDDEFLSQIKHPEKVEFIVNHSCTTNCTMSKLHHKLIDEMQKIKTKYNNDKNVIYKQREYLDYKKQIDELLDKCRKIKFENNIYKLCRQNINTKEINHLVNTFGINHFKIEGRDLSVFEFYFNFNKYLLNNDSIFELLSDINDYKPNTNYKSYIAL